MDCYQKTSIDSIQMGGCLGSLNHLMCFLPCYYMVPVKFSSLGFLQFKGQFIAKSYNLVYSTKDVCRFTRHLMWWLPATGGYLN